MAQQGNQPPDAEPKEPFVAGEERPEVRLNPDMPVAEMRVRDLAELIGIPAAKPVATESGIKKPEVKDFKFEKWEHKYELKDHKFEKWEYKNELKDHKLEKWEHKHEKWEHKFELKDAKHEKLEHKDPLVEVIKREPEVGPDPRQYDPRIDEVIKQISDLAAAVADLKQRIDK